MRLVLRFNNKNYELPEPYAKDDRFRFEAIEASEITFVQRGAAMSTLQYSLDNGTTWTNADADMDLLLNAGGKAYFRGKITSNADNGRSTKFGITGKVAAKGNIMYLYNYEHPEITTLTYTYCFSVLFNSCLGLYDIENLELPATTMSKRCYDYMFSGCSNVTKPPKVFAATTLASECFTSTFRGTGLTESPVLLYKSATATNACYGMFAECTSLTKITAYATSVSTGCLRDWLKGASSTGDFYNLGGASYSRSTSGIPSGWTVHTSL